MPEATVTHAELVQIAAMWLKRKGCNVVLTERDAGGECPDAIGWQVVGFHSIVVECKVSRSDFAADAAKPWRQPGQGMGAERWYLVPAGLVDGAILPLRWGLLCWTGRRVERRVMSSPSASRDIVAEAHLLLSELRIYHAQGLTYKAGAERWGARTDS